MSTRSSCPITGGRQVDNALASLDAAGHYPAKRVGPQPTILLDSGIRSGTDVLIGLALGAVMPRLLGRPYIYGLALDGEDGVRQVIENIVAELDVTMGAGRRWDSAGPVPRPPHSVSRGPSTW